MHPVHPKNLALLKFGTCEAEEKYLVKRLKNLKVLGFKACTRSMKYCQKILYTKNKQNKFACFQCTMQMSYSEGKYASDLHISQFPCSSFKCTAFSPVRVRRGIDPEN
jgi:hypothetical protein